MFIDALGQLSDAQALTAGTTVSTNKVDLGDRTPKRQIGIGEALALVMTVDVAAAGSTDTFRFDVVTDGDAALGSPAILSSRTIAKAKLVAGAQFVFPLPPDLNYERYLGAQYVVGSGDTITVSMSVVPLSFVGTRQDYAKGYES